MQTAIIFSIGYLLGVASVITLAVIQVKRATHTQRASGRNSHRSIQNGHDH